MKNNLPQKATLSFNIIKNKMSNRMEISNDEMEMGMEISYDEEERGMEISNEMKESNKIFQDYQNSGLYFSLEEVRERIEDLTTQLKGSKYYYRRLQNEEEKEKQREEIFEIQDEIDFYNQQIYNKEIYNLTQEQDIEEKKPETKIDVLEKKINGVEGVVYQLLGGLFNQETQINVLDSHLEYLKGNIYTGKIAEQSIFPTTRQGDQHEEEIRLLKQQVSRLEDTVSLLVRIIIKDQM